jgi:hypothetical protein
VWTLTLGSRPQARREIVLLPPAQEALGRYFETRDVGPGMPADLPLIASSYNRRSRRPTSPRHTLHSIAKPVFALASRMALEKGEVLAARRLWHGSSQWLCHAFEVHAAHRGRADIWAGYCLALTSSYHHRFIRSCLTGSLCRLIGSWWGSNIYSRCGELRNIQSASWGVCPDCS